MNDKPNSGQIIGVKTPKDKEKERRYPLRHVVKFSFYITYVFLMTTATITIIEALRTPSQYIRNILNLETAISVVAGYFYSVFIGQLDEFNKNDIPIDWRDISSTRYVDWSITTPMMLLSLCGALAYNLKIPLKWTIMITVVVLNYFMLCAGYLGETGSIDRTTAMVIGFVALFSMLYIIFSIFIYPHNNMPNNILFGVYAFVWSMYGVVYMFSEEYKNIITNVLDLIAKCFVGLGLWLYYCKLMQ
jgi:bacteriorhodopsin